MIDAGSSCGVCSCVPGYLGALCHVVAQNSVVLGGGKLSLSYTLDVENPQLAHFRLDSTQTHCISLMVIASSGDFKTGDSATVYYSNTGQWVLEDQFSHPYVSVGKLDYAHGGQQNLLLNGLVWQPSWSSFSASWSRLLSTGDTAADQVISVSGM